MADHQRLNAGSYSGPRAWTKPGTLLKRQIPILTFATWDETRPGFVEVELVVQCGQDACGDFAQTLNVTDALTGWTELQAVQNKAQIHVLRRCKPSGRSCRSRCWALTRTTGRNLSTRN